MRTSPTYGSRWIQKQTAPCRWRAARSRWSRPSPVIISRRRAFCGARATTMTRGERRRRRSRFHELIKSGITRNKSSKEPTRRARATEPKAAVTDASAGRGGATPQVGSAAPPIALSRSCSARCWPDAVAHALPSVVIFRLGWAAAVLLGFLEQLDLLRQQLVL